MTGEPLKSPYPYPGGKSRVADLIWERIGNVDNAIEPFMGSLVWLLRRPAYHFEKGYRVETAGDINHFIVNFWRAVKADPEGVARFADNPVLEADLHARHRWLMKSDTTKKWRVQMKTDPECYDIQIAGWWVWGMCCWIGSGWCDIEGVEWNQRPHISHQSGMGVQGRPQLTDAFDIGRGVNSGGKVGSLKNKAPRLGAVGGNGVNKGDGLSQQIPELAPDSMRGIIGKTGGTSMARADWLSDWMTRLSDRLRLVRTCYGHWDRICDSESTMTRLGTTGVMLDPPYPLTRADNGKGSRSGGLYAGDESQDLNKLRDEVFEWCKRWGQSKEVRIALCCYEGDGYEPLAEMGWDVHEWETAGGYANQSKKKKKDKVDNSKRERIYFSPHCESIDNVSLFDGID